MNAHENFEKKSQDLYEKIWDLLYGHTPNMIYVVLFSTLDNFLKHDLTINRTDSKKLREILDKSFAQLMRNIK